MKLFSLKNLAMTGALSVAGLGLVGMGAHAVFTAQTTSSQEILAGTPGVAISMPGTSCPNADWHCTSVTMPLVGPTNSTFTSGDQVLTLTNTGNIPMTEDTISFAVTSPTSALATEAQVCFGSTGLGTGGAWYPIYNGSLAGFNGVSYSQAGDVLTIAGTAYSMHAPVDFGPTDSFVLNVYAGAETTACGPSTAGSLGMDAISQSVVLTSTETYNG